MKNRRKKIYPKSEVLYNLRILYDKKLIFSLSYVRFVL